MGALLFQMILLLYSNEHFADMNPMIVFNYGDSQFPWILFKTFLNTIIFIMMHYKSKQASTFQNIENVMVSLHYTVGIDHLIHQRIH